MIDREDGDERLAAIITAISFIIALIVAVCAMPKPTGDSRVYDAYVEDMRQHGRKPNGEPIK